MRTQTDDNDNRHLWDQLNNAITLSAKQDQIIWTIFGIFWAANAVLLVGLVSPKDFPNATVGMLISLVGAFISIAWSIIQFCANEYLDLYDNVIEKLERELLNPEEQNQYALSARLNSFKVGGVKRVRDFMFRCSTIPCILWPASLVVFFLQFLS